MKASLKLYWTLFRTTFFLSAFTFGGGYVIVSLMRKKFVEELSWLTEEEMLNFTAIAQSSPGAVAVNASVLVGYRVGKLPGALISVLGTVLPPMLVLSVISLFYAAFQSSPLVAAVLRGMRSGVVAVIADVVCSMGKTVIREEKWFSCAVMVLAFLAVWLFELNAALVILASGAAGALRTVWKRRTREGER